MLPYITSWFRDVLVPPGIKGTDIGGMLGPKVARSDRPKETDLVIVDRRSGFLLTQK
jgi:hypothetical protein